MTAHEKMLELEFELMAVVNYLMTADYTTDEYNEALVKGMELKMQLKELLGGE